jgi:hypothetical protein
MTTPLTAQTQLDRQYHEMRWRLLSLAADFDRLQRYSGDVQSDPRLADLRECVKILLTDTPDRAERLQSLLSDKSGVGK